MKKLSLLSLIVITAYVTTAPVSWSDDIVNSYDIMMLKSDEFGHLKRPEVKFNHNMHEKNYLCNECHHNNDLFKDSKNRKSAVCSSCHKIDKNPDVPIPLIDAFHMKCKGCHKKNLKFERNTGPVMCGSCHKR